MKQMKMKVKFHGLVKFLDRQCFVSGSQIKDVENAGNKEYREGLERWLNG